MATDQTFIQLNFSDRKGASAGTVILGLGWANQPEPSDEPNVNRWAVVQCSDGFDQRLMSWEGSGLFDAKNWGVMWLWDNEPSSQNKHNNLILWDAPTDRFDCKHLTGGGKVYDPRNPQGKYLTVKWATWWAEKCKTFWQEF
jgi:hypothetical protein